MCVRTKACVFEGAGCAILQQTLNGSAITGHHRESTNLLIENMVCVCCHMLIMMSHEKQYMLIRASWHMVDNEIIDVRWAVV